MVEQRESESTIATRSAVRISIFCERGVGRDASATNEAAVPTGNVGRDCPQVSFRARVPQIFPSSTRISTITITNTKPRPPPP